MSAMQHGSTALNARRYCWCPRRRPTRWRAPNWHHDRLPRDRRGRAHPAPKKFV